MLGATLYPSLSTTKPTTTSDPTKTLSSFSLISSLSTQTTSPTFTTAPTTTTSPTLLQNILSTPTTKDTSVFPSSTPTTYTYTRTSTSTSTPASPTQTLLPIPGSDPIRTYQPEPVRQIQAESPMNTLQQQGLPSYYAMQSTLPGGLPGGLTPWGDSGPKQEPTGESFFSKHKTHLIVAGVAVGVIGVGYVVLGRRKSRR